MSKSGCRDRLHPLKPRAALLLLGLSIIGVTGCPPTTPSNDGDVPFLDQDGNFTFDQATKLTLEDDTLTFDGEIDGGADLDLYDIGRIAPGDRVRADISRRSGNLDSVAAIFNSDEELHAFSDDRTRSDLDPLIDFIVRGSGTDDFVLGIAPYQADNPTTTGRYRVTVTIERGVGAPKPRAQAVFLDWDGGENISVRNVGTFDLPAFDAASLGRVYAGRTDEMKKRVQDIVEDRYAGFSLGVLNSDDDAKPSFAHSTIYFGANSDDAFAISENVDSYNTDADDNAIVFTDGFEGAFSRVPTFDEMSLAIGNTTAHEIGHLLGLVHTDDCAELMNSTCGNSRILVQQELGSAPLDPRLFPVGVQAADELLEWTLGMLGQ